MRCTTPVFRQAEDRGGGGVFHFFVQRDQHIIQNGQIAEQADVLERAGDTHVVDFDRGLPCRGDAIEQNTPARRLVDIRQEVEDRSFARTVRADQSGDLGRADGDVEIADRGQTAKVNAEMACFKNRAACHIALGQQVGIGLRNQLCDVCYSCSAASFFDFFTRFGRKIRFKTASSVRDSEKS